MITSPANPRIKLLRKLQTRKERQASSLFYMEGLRIVTAAVQAAARGRGQVEYLVWSEELLKSEPARRLVETQAQAGLPALEVSAETFRSFALKDGPQGLAAVGRQHFDALPADLSTGFWVGLDAVADPGNLGTILRTCDSAGGQGVILLDQSTDPYDPTAVRASMGALFSQKIVRAGFAEFAAWKQAAGVPVFGASGAAASDYHATRYPDPCILLMGSERQGLLEHHIQLCDCLVRIPMVGSSDSLNLAVATAILMYEVFNQRRAPGAANLSPEVLP
jgi:TrmH family RNA methyltransferase